MTQREGTSLSGGQPTTPHNAVHYRVPSPVVSLLAAAAAAAPAGGVSRASPAKVTFSAFANLASATPAA